MAEAQSCREATAASLLSVTLSPLLWIVYSQEADCFLMVAQKSEKNALHRRKMSVQ